MVSSASPVPPPPVPFDAIEYRLEAGRSLHRVHDRKRAADAFNPGLGLTRFAPFKGEDGDSEFVPTLYAAATAEAAVCESLLHDVPLSGGLLTDDVYAQRQESVLKVARDLRLAMFMGDGLRRLGVLPQQLTATDADCYEVTVLWARAAHAAGFDGVVWMSTRENSSQAYVLFGSRVGPNDLQASEEGIGSFARGSAGFSWLSAYCARVKVELLTA